LSDGVTLLVTVVTKWRHPAETRHTHAAHGDINNPGRSYHASGRLAAAASIRNGESEPPPL
jgi:hypothetical protein